MGSVKVWSDGLHRFSAIALKISTALLFVVVNRTSLWKSYLSSLKFFFLSPQIIFPIQKAKTVTALEFKRRVVQLKCEIECVSN